VLVAVLISSLNAARGRLEAALREQDRRKDEFLAMLAHELRNPLSTISNSMHVLRLKGRKDAPVEHTCDLVGRQIQHMSRLINDLLDVSRIHLGKMQLCEEVVDVSTIVDHAIEVTRSFLDAGNHQLEVSLPPAQVYLRADPTRLEQILVNLLTNATKYTEPGGHIQLTVEQAQGNVLLRVRDTGIGLTPEAIPRVFDLYMQAENGSKGGLGIGLNLVRSLVRMHGGSVTAFSHGPGRGSEFVVRLPAPAEAPPVRQGAATSAH
jgi:signal transduction histidine kinase